MRGLGSSLYDLLTIQGSSTWSVWPTLYLVLWSLHLCIISVHHCEQVLHSNFGGFTVKLHFANISITYMTGWTTEERDRDVILNSEGCPGKPPMACWPFSKAMSNRLESAETARCGSLLSTEAELWKEGNADLHALVRCPRS